MRAAVGVYLVDFSSLIRPQAYWYTHRAALPWLPLEALFRGVAAGRRWAYRTGVLPSFSLGVPVVVVGNLSVGGTGKTPLVIAIVKALQRAAYTPGVITRGYGGRAQSWPRPVTPDSDPALVGDEPVLIARHCQCPVVAAPDRVAAGRALLGQHDCNVIVTDDGLQHYRLKRDVEIVVVDGARGFGNGHCLPAGPLREPVSRLRRADFVVANGEPRAAGFGMTLSGDTAISCVDASRRSPLNDFLSQPVHAVAGIGNPERFFGHLEAAGLRLVRHVFPDHHRFAARDLRFDDDLPVLMTEKDAVKCRAMVTDRHWYVPVQAELDAGFFPRLLDSIQSALPTHNVS